VSSRGAAGDEGSAFFLVFRNKQIPRFARDDNKKERFLVAALACRRQAPRNDEEMAVSAACEMDATLNIRTILIGGNC
jgi:hypothetical protein